MKSLRGQLLLGTALGTTVVLLVCGTFLYALISRALRAEFDDSLAARARSLTALAEQEEEGLEFELTEVSLPEFEPSSRAEFYQVWLSDGTVFSRSRSLLDQDLDRIAGTLENPAFRTVRLPDGQPGRIVGMTFAPRREHAGAHSEPPLAVTLVLGRNAISLETTLARVRGILIGVGIIAVVLAAGVLAAVVRRNLRPVDQLSRQIAKVGADGLSVRIGAGGIPTELSPVVDRLNDLLVRMDAAFQRERRFTGDVAHELRTPLAGLRSKLELALARDRAPEAYRSTMRDCLEINLQMQRMIENLLHLARADAGQLEIRHEPVDLAKVLRDCWKPFEERANARRLSIEYDLDEIGTLATDRDKLQLVLQNLAENAILYTDDGGRVSVTTSAEDGVVVLAVRNTGGALSADELPQVFDRFWRGDAHCGAGHAIHCGLGLPLCKALVEQLGGAIEATADAAGTFTVTIRLPRVEAD